MKKIAIALLFVSCLGMLFPQLTKAQGGHTHCDMPDAPAVDHLAGINPQDHLNRLGGPSYTIRIYIHAMRLDDGSGGATWEEIMGDVERMRDDYAPAGICFMIVGTETINNTALSMANDSIIALYNLHSDAIDIYILPSDHPRAGRSFSIISGKFVLNTYKLGYHSMAHEMGHCFGLYHTHQGGNELVDGSNCGSAGDFVCDTPADPNLNDAGNMSGCTYVGTSTDANGDSYSPDPTNIMSYAPASCRQGFSSGQLIRALTTIGTSISVLLPTVASTSNLILSNSTHSSGEELKATTGTIFAGDVIGLGDYTVNGSAYVTFSSASGITLVDGFRADPNSSGEFLASSKNYICAVGGSRLMDPDEADTPLTTQTTTRDYVAEINMEVYPNPFSSTATVGFGLPDAHDISVYLMNSMGQRVRTLADGQHYQAGNHTLTFERKDLPDGIYYCILEIGNNRYNQKVILRP